MGRAKRTAWLGRAGAWTKQLDRVSGAARVAELRKDCSARMDCGARSYHVEKRERRRYMFGNKDIHIIFISWKDLLGLSLYYLEYFVKILCDYGNIITVS